MCLQSFNCNYVVSVRRGFLFIWVFGLGCVILLWHSLSLPYNYFVNDATTGDFDLEFYILSIEISSKTS